MTKPLIVFKRIHPDAKLPAYATDQASGADVVSVEAEEGSLAAIVGNDAPGIVIAPKTWRPVATGLQADIPPGWEIQVRAKSGRALKEGLTVLNGPGTIDSDYRGEIKVLLVNHSDRYVFIKKGEKIAQLVVSPVVQGLFFEVRGDLSQTVRGDGGFGSTGL